jgi:hypothetical protein
MKRLVPIAMALSLTILLANIAVAQEGAAKLSDALDGPAMTQFPSGTTVVYATFDWTGRETEQIKVRVYDNYGSILFEQTQEYTGTAIESVSITTSEGYFPDGRYVTNFYRDGGDKLYRTIIWNVGEPVARPVATPTTTASVKIYNQAKDLVKDLAVPAALVILIVLVAWAIYRVLAAR